MSTFGQLDHGDDVATVNPDASTIKGVPIDPDKFHELWENAHDRMAAADLAESRQRRKAVEGLKSTSTEDLEAAEMADMLAAFGTRTAVVFHDLEADVDNKPWEPTRTLHEPSVGQYWQGERADWASSDPAKNAKNITKPYEPEKFEDDCA